MRVLLERNFQLKDSRKDDVRINVLNHRYYFTKLFVQASQL